MKNLHVASTVSGVASLRARPRNIYSQAISKPACKEKVFIAYSLSPCKAANATTFGNLSFSSIKRGGLSDGTRGLWVGSSTPGYGDRMDYIAISSSGSASDFGNLAVGRSNPGCASGS